MIYRIFISIAFAVTVMIGAANAAIITVNTADNTDFGAGKTNLVRAINLLANGDTINFNIPGAGPHFLITPAMVTGAGGGGGYPEITNNNVTINGYSQPGAAPNSNPILAANNAQIKIVLDSRTGGAHVWDISGYGTSESGILVVSGNNVTLKGLSLLGIYGDDSDESPKRYGVALGNRGGNDVHINGCWFGVAPDGTTIAGFADGVTGFRHRTPTDVLTDRAVIGVKPGSANPKAEFNVLVDLMIPIIIEGAETRISGNFFGVLPDGLTRVPNPYNPIGDFGWEGHIELARAPYNIVIGTDGDGVNDADERNLLSGGVHDSLGAFTTEATYNQIIEFYGGGTRTNIVIAGNYVGVAVDGSTFLTNATRLKNGWGTGTTVQIGSDLNGVSDALEANVIANNHPFGDFYPDPTVAAPPEFAGLDVGELISVRGNVLLNNHLAPFTYANGAGTRLFSFTNYALPYMDPVTNSIIPTLDPTSTSAHLMGTFAYGINDYTNIIIDVYQLDQEGWNNGKAIAGAGNWTELTDSGSFTNGFAQGAKYLGSRVVPNTGSFDISLSSMGFGGGPVTVTANYSLDPAGTTRARVHTSDFSIPVNLAFIPGSAESVGLTRIVPDTIVWSHSQNFAGGGVTKIGGYVTGEQATEGTSVEGTVGVLGDSTFLIAAITRATNDDANMSFTSVLIPATGGTPKLDNTFYTDAGTKWLKKVNLSRQTGNPGRIGGDPRFGAVNYGGAGEVSLFAYPEFNSDGRWSNPFFADALARDCRSYGGQLFRLDPSTLVSTPTSRAVDPMFGRLWTNSVATIGGQDFGRTGSSPIGLDNGNFVFVGEDRTGFNNSGGNRRAAVATIFAPNGAIVKEAFSVTPDGAGDGSMWNSVGAFRGGFFVRPAGGVIYFYDNAGNLQGTNNHNATSGLIYDVGRSDGTRMCSDIRSRYVFQAGKSPESGAFTNIMLTAYDANTRLWITNTIVSTEGNQDLTSLGSTRLLDRCNLACDAYNRVAVVYRLKPDRVAFTQEQIAARIFSFDGTKFTPLTPTFFPFIEHDADPNSLAGFKSIEPSVAMTPREILFYSKGMWNGTANPTNAVATLDNTHCYTILRHPAPIAAPRPAVTITKSGNNLDLSWNPDDGLFTVQTRSAVNSGPWANATAGNVAPPVSIPAGAGPLYVRLAR